MNMWLISMTFDTSHVEMSPSNSVAPMNMWLISMTFDTSHVEMSPLNDLSFMKTELISVIFDMSHSLIGPCGPVEQMPLGDKSKQLSMAILSSVLEWVENAVVLHTVDDIDPNDPSNISVLLAFE